MVGVCTYGPDSHKDLSEKGLGSGSHVPSKNAWPIIILPYSFVLIKVLIVGVFRFLKKNNKNCSTQGNTNNDMLTKSNIKYIQRQSKKKNQS